MKKLSVIISAYNSRDYLEAILRKLVSYNIDIIVVDSANMITKNITDNYRNYININVIENRHLGDEYGRSLALDVIKTGYFCFATGSSFDIDSYLSLVSKMSENSQKLGCLSLKNKYNGITYSSKRKEGVYYKDEYGLISSISTDFSSKVFSRSLIPFFKEGINNNLYLILNILTSIDSVYFSNNTVTTEESFPSFQNIYEAVSKLKDKEDGEYFDEIIAKAILFCYAKITKILKNKTISNKEEMISEILRFLSALDENYMTNPLYYDTFKNIGIFSRLNLLYTKHFLKNSKIDFPKESPTTEDILILDRIIDNV